MRILVAGSILEVADAIGLALFRSLQRLPKNPQ